MAIHRKFSSILVTGGSGFIGSNFIRLLLESEHFDGRIINLDKLTYAGNPYNLSDIDARYSSRYTFVHGDICNHDTVDAVFKEYSIDTVVHFAAESHVDRSIHGPGEFIQTNIVGTYTLLDVARDVWKDRDDVLFHHVSTDEVFGSLGESGYFTEDTPYDPRSPYSASKASSDHLVRAYHHTYGLPVTVSNCSNNYGPYQFPEKLIPLMILNMRDGKPLPVYGDGKNIRDWIYVDDHNRGVLRVMQEGASGATYTLGGENEWENITLVKKLCDIMGEITGKGADTYHSLITYVTDRPGHDRRYAIDCSHIKNELNWSQEKTFEEGLRSTVQWYLQHEEWIEQIRQGEYLKWIERNYSDRD